MMGLIGFFVGALLGTFLVSRLSLWLTKRMGDTPAHVITGHLVCYAFIVAIGSYGFADGGPLNPLTPMALYIVPQLIWLGVDFLALKGRRARAKEKLDVFE